MTKRSIIVIQAIIMILICTSCVGKLKHDKFDYYYEYNVFSKEYARNEWKVVDNKLLYFGQNEYIASESELPYGFYYDENKDIKRKDFEIMTFGKYEQDNDIENGSEDIEWIIIDENETTYKLLSRYVLDKKLFHDCADLKMEVTWEESSLRKFLNEDFINIAFGDDEKKRIVEVFNINENDTRYGIAMDNATIDKCYLLNYVESNRYLPIPEYRICKATDYAKSSGVYTDKTGRCNYYLRSISNLNWNVAGINLYGEYVSLNNTSGADGIRPVINIKK